MPRLFIAIDVPEQLKESLADLTGEIPGAKWVGATEIHLTLRFIGEVDPHAFSQIKTVLSEVGFSSFALSLRGIGHFPPHGHPRVLWVGLEPCPELMLLQQRIESALKQIGINPDERRFSPHLTLARFKDTPAATVTRFESKHRDLALPPFDVDQFILYSSVLAPRGAIHTKEMIYRCSRADSGHPKP